MGKLDLRALSTGNKLKRKGDHLAFQRVGVADFGRARQLERRTVVAIKFQPPGGALHKQQLADADLGVERQLAPATVAAAENLDEEIYRACSKLAMVLSSAATPNHDDVGSAIVLRPMVNAIAYVCAGKNLA